LDRLLLAYTVSAVLIVTQVIIAIYLLRLRMRTVKGRLTKIAFSPEILAGFEVWLTRSVAIHMVRYLEEKMGKEYSREDEIAVNSEFAIVGIDYVCSTISISIPDFYQNYMIAFYGEDKFLTSIYERVRAVFIEYVNKEMQKRLNGAAKTS
jgi:hypothetical protein